MEEDFVKIAEDTIEAAEALDCPFSDFVDGLETVIRMLQERLEQAHDEQ